MNTAPIIAALALPAGSVVEQRVPKKLLIEQGTPAAGDKKQVQDGLAELVWQAALKPTNIGVPAFSDATREYLEIAVLVASLRPLAKRTRLIELIHRAIPYPVFLITYQGECVSVSVAHKRWSQGEAGKVVLDDAVVTTEPFDPAKLLPQHAVFLSSLSVSVQPSANLYALYHGWLARITALRAADITGRAEGVAEPTGDLEARRSALAEHSRLSAELAGLRATAAKEKQVNRRVELNLAVRRLESQIQTIAATL
ncbi:MAG: DUF4391 domain-containing protein [Opitutaceae bacterium]|nr:DUF4391 domain-containing protein [Opitutaceae bacterium]